MSALSVLAASAEPGADTANMATGEVTERQTDLKTLRSQIETLRKEMAASEASRRDALDDIKDSERAISQAQRELHALAQKNSQLKAALNDLAMQSTELEKRLKGQQTQLEKLLYHQYLRGNPDPLRLFLNGEDANQLARDLHYLEAIGRVRSQVLQEVETSLRQQRTLTAETRQKAAQLAAVEAQQQQEHARLLAQRRQRQAMLDRVSTQIAAQQREIGNLQRDERRMTELIDRLSKIIAAKAAEAREAARREAREVERKAAEKREAERRDLESARRRAASTPEKRVEKPLRPPIPGSEGTAPAATAEQELQPSRPAAVPPTVGGLTRMKGQLHPPARGVVANRFGALRQEGSTWRGLFIRAGSGSEVRSIAGGRVVFAEWMRGFGNLLIVDHGDSYLSVYANNEALLKQVGDDVRGGETIASVGNSGGHPESGLYFELRHQGRPLDPSGWLNLK